MTDAVLTDIDIIAPYRGGVGARLTCSTSSSRVAIPGTEAGNKPPRLIITNGGAVSAFVRLGDANVVASIASTTCSIEILPGSSVLFKAPFAVPNQLYMAGITEAGSTKVSVIAGTGETGV
jgi:hypothetical protein